MSRRGGDFRGRSLNTGLSREEQERLDALWQIRMLVKELQDGEQFLNELVTRSRRFGATWEEIGTSAGITASSAHRRWSPFAKPRTKEGAKRNAARRRALREEQGQLAM